MRYLAIISSFCLLFITVHIAIESNENETILSLDIPHSYLQQYQDDVYQIDFYTTKKETEVFDVSSISRSLIKDTEMSLPIEITGIYHTNEAITYEEANYFVVTVVYHFTLFQQNTIYSLEHATLSFFHDVYGIVELPIGSFSLAFKDPSDTFQINTLNASYDEVDGRNIMSGFVVEIVNTSEITQTLKSIDLYIPHVVVQNRLITYVDKYDSAKKLSYQDFLLTPYQSMVLPDESISITLYPRQSILLYIPLGYEKLISISSFFWSIDTSESDRSFFDDFPLRSTPTILEEGVEYYQTTYTN